MVVRTSGNEVEEFIPLFDVRTVVVTSPRNNLTAHLIHELHSRQIRLIFCDEKRMPYGEIVGYRDHHAVPDRLKEQIRWKPKCRKETWMWIVFQKMRMQRNLLIRLGLSFDTQKWQKYQDTLETGDRSNREGQAARLYFNTLFGKKFHRRQESPVNMALNYGYAILCSTVTRSITIHGYHPSLGMAHCGGTNPFNLSYDLMEPFRPWVDEIVYRRKEEPLDKEFKRELIGIANQQVVYQKKRMSLDSAVDLYVLEIMNALREGTKPQGEMEFTPCEKP